MYTYTYIYTGIAFCVPLTKAVTQHKKTTKKKKELCLLDMICFIVTKSKSAWKQQLQNIPLKKQVACPRAGLGAGVAVFRAFRFDCRIASGRT